MNLNILKIPSDHNGEMSGHLSFSDLANILPYFALFLQRDARFRLERGVKVYISFLRKFLCV